MPGQAYTAAILLGASVFPSCQDYEPNQAFLHSKQGFRAYLQDADKGLAVLEEAILDLFDSHDNVTQQLLSIGRFLDRINRESDRQQPRNLIVYYVGHGYFAGERQEYYVALASLTAGYETATGLKLMDLAGVIKDKGRFFRRFVFLDCCFAAEALAGFMGAADDAVAAKADAAFAEDATTRSVEVPYRGTALFCASDRHHVALSPQALGRTMFSDALLDALACGDKTIPNDLTLADLCALTWEKLREKHAEPVRPVLHAPDQTQGDITRVVSLFPNVARRETVSGNESDVAGKNRSSSRAGEDSSSGTGKPSPDRQSFRASMVITALGLAVATYLGTQMHGEHKQEQQPSQEIIPAPTPVAPTSPPVSRSAEQGTLGVDNATKEGIEHTTINAKVFFERGKEEIGPEQQQKLDELLRSLTEWQIEIITVVGFADDSDGLDNDAIKALATRRADAVKKYLVAKGIAPEVIYTEGGVRNTGSATPSAGPQVRSAKVEAVVSRRAH